jgi:GNAT superfamily N-acetyltransferase
VSVEEPLIALEDVSPFERKDKVEDALGRFTLAEAKSLADFEAGYSALLGEFGPTGEIERRETLEAWFAAGSLSAPNAPIRASYHLVLARDREGQLAGVRDCFVTVDARAGRCVVLLSHTLVLPAHRRTGLAALLRTVPASLARRALRDAGVASGEVLLAAEMEMVAPEDPASVVRLLAYGRAGFHVVPPEALPYAQPDFRDLDALGVEPVPLPFLAVVRQVGDESRMTLSRERALAIIHHLQAVHICHCRPGDLVPIREHALGALAAYPQDPIPLLRVPPGPERVAELRPLLHSVVFHLYPEAWWNGETRADPEEELAALISVWTEKAKETAKETP